jgi:hypothetical protein
VVKAPYSVNGACECCDNPSGKYDNSFKVKNILGDTKIHVTKKTMVNNLSFSKLFLEIIMNNKQNANIINFVIYIVRRLLRAKKAMTTGKSITGYLTLRLLSRKTLKARYTINGYIVHNINAPFQSSSN